MLGVLGPPLMSAKFYNDIFHFANTVKPHYDQKWKADEN